MSQPRLLLPQAPGLVVAVRNNDLEIISIPDWLLQRLGIARDTTTNTGFGTLLEERLPGIGELARSVVDSRAPVPGFQTVLKTATGGEMPVLLHAACREDARRGLLVEITVSDADSSAAREHLERQSTAFFGLIGKSAPMVRVFNRIRLYGAVDSPVLVQGETGAGKEGVAAALHSMSRRSKGPFIAVNCSAISEALLESELFGHEKGSFTGALKTHKGRFERADQGTLFLDEIGDMPMGSQTKLLRVLETSMLERVGGEQTLKVDVRVVAATNKNLEAEIARQTFRADLFYRLNALQIFVPPLRDRPEDIPLLVNHFIDQLNQKYDRRLVCVSPEAIHLLKQYQWPGNVRELRNLMERLFAENHSEVIGLRALREWYDERMQAAKNLKYDPRVTPLPYRSIIPLGMEPDEVFEKGRNKGAKAELTREQIQQAFQETGGNMTQAARRLGVHKATLYRHLKSLGLSREGIQDPALPESTPE
jgi:DNA-binding NtrC family response regulator